MLKHRDQFIALDRKPIGGVKQQANGLTIAGLVEEAKKSSSKWMKVQGASYHDFFWQGGYGAFSVSQSNVDAVRAYVVTQEEHHRSGSFQDEFRALCGKHGVEIDDRYVWDLNLHHGRLFRPVGAWHSIYASGPGRRSSLDCPGLAC
ncbi:MAG: transposase [Verrucomicrobiota bacterium]